MKEEAPPGSAGSFLPVFRTCSRAAILVFRTFFHTSSLAPPSGDGAACRIKQVCHLQGSRPGLVGCGFKYRHRGLQPADPLRITDLGVSPEGSTWSAQLGKCWNHNRQRNVCVLHPCKHPNRSSVQRIRCGWHQLGSSQMLEV